MILNNITEAIGQTPVVRLASLSMGGVSVYAKLEARNPGGSVKDRMALGIITDAEQRGILTPGQTVVEATSGNSGIALALVCAQRGYPFVAVMAENFSVERRKLMRMLGARVVITPASGRGSGMLAKARELANVHGWFLPSQFDNPANAGAHSRTTAEEILSDFAETGLDYWVSGAGTGGTLLGVARILRQRLPNLRVVVAEPDNAPVLASEIGGGSNEPVVPHPAFRPHLMQGWSPDFVPALTRAALDEKLVDRIEAVGGRDALSAARDLASREGILAGISGGATLAAGLKVARSAPEGTRILVMLPDTGERYLSTPLFADVPVHMTSEEWALSRSTPGHRLDVSPATPEPAPANATSAVSPDAAKEVERIIADASQPVVMFALEWCEFCWSVRRMFAHFGVPFRSVDLDSVAMQSGNRGGAIRTALTARTGVATIPQIFIGGRFVGGSTELFDAWRRREAQPMLEAAGVTYRTDRPEDPASFMPTWLHPRSE